MSGTCDLGTGNEGLGDIKYGTLGRVGRGRGDVDEYFKSRRLIRYLLLREFYL